MSSTDYFTAEQLKAGLAQLHRVTAAAKKVTKNGKLPVAVLAATQSELFSAVHKLLVLCRAQPELRVPDPQEANQLSAIISKFMRCGAGTVTTTSLWRAY